jgi:hypothetical protein
VEAGKVEGQWSTIHVDRGYASVAAAQQLTDLDCHYNINMPLNRKGLPRIAMATLAAAMGEKWQYAVWHKGANELLVWNDGKPVYFLSDSLTSARVGVLKRSTPKATAVYFVEVPEMPWAYNVYGRSGTDGHDQLRKDNQIANRRILRDGVKGMLFTFDVCLTNACIMNKVAVDAACVSIESGNKKRKLRETVTKSAFLERLTDQVFSTKSLRKYVPASAMQSTVSPPKQPQCRAGNQQQHSDFLVDYRLHFQQQKAAAIAHKTKHPREAKKGRCAVCTADGASKQYKTIWCNSWCSRCEKWHHVECAKRRCTPKRRMGAGATIGAS